MKKSRIAKFALLGASTAALAATLTTSTYAWYVSNKTANTTAVTGQTTAGSADGSISLSKSGKEGSFKKEIELDPLTGTLTPVDRTGATSAPVYKTLAEDTDADATTANVIDVDASTVLSSNSHYSITFYILAASTCYVNPDLKVTNTTTDFAKQVNYSSNSNVGSVTDGMSFTVDARTAMHYSVRLEEGSWVTTEGTTKGNYVDGTQVSDQTEKLGSTYSHLAGQITATSYGTTHATGGAQEYYNEITEKALYGEALTSYTGTAVSNLHLTGGVPYKLTYEIWLDGAEATCFNCCAGQSFSIQFEYTVASE